MVKNALTRHFDYGCNQCSQVRPDFARIVKFDSDGTELVSYERVDYPSLVSSNGLFKDWSLDSLVKAGINPNFGIRTGSPTRLEGIPAIDSFDKVAESIVNESKTE